VRTHRFFVSTLLGVSIALSGGSLSSQEPEGELEGERVRITYVSNGPHVIEGLLREVAGPALLVAPSADRVVAIPQDQVTDFRVLRGRERQWKKGLFRGAASGAVAGTLIYLVLEESLESIFGESSSTSPGVLAYTAVGALYGAGIGMGIGLLFWKDRWESVPLPTIIPSFQVTPDRRLNVGFNIPVGR